MVDEQHRGPAVDHPAQPLAEVAALGARQARPPARRGTAASAAPAALGRRRPACAGPGSARSAWRSASSSSPRSLDGLLDRRRRPARGRRTSSFRVVSSPRAAGRDAQVLPHGEVVEQLGGLPRAGEPGTRTLVWRERAMTSSPVEAHRAAVGHEPADRVDERRLAGAVRADQADELCPARPRGRRRPAPCTPPNGPTSPRAESAGVMAPGATPGRVGPGRCADAVVAGPSRGASLPASLSCRLPERRRATAPRSGGSEHDGEDQGEPGDQQLVVDRHAEPYVQAEVGHEPFGGEQAADDRPPRPS